MTKPLPPGSNSAALTKPQTAYAHKAVVYLPHYNKPGLFVGPGMTGKKMPLGRCIKEADLVKVGANRITLMLWERAE